MVLFDHDDDKPREECGVFGIYGNHEASLLTALGLHALHHQQLTEATLQCVDAVRDLVAREARLCQSGLPGLDHALNG